MVFKKSSGRFPGVRALVTGFDQTTVKLNVFNERPNPRKAALSRLFAGQRVFTL